MRWSSSSWPCWLSAAAVWEALWGSTPIITGMRAPFSKMTGRHRGGQADFGWQRGLWSDLPAPWNPTAAAQGSYPDSISRRRVVEVAALPGSALAIAARRALDLGDGEPAARPDLVGLHLDNRALLALRGLPGAGTQPTDHDRAGALDQRLGDVLGLLAPHVDPEERGVAVLPALTVAHPGRDGEGWKLATAAPLGVNRSSGSSVRLPTSTTWLSAAMQLLLLPARPPRAARSLLRRVVAVRVPFSAARAGRRSCRGRPASSASRPARQRVPTRGNRRSCGGCRSRPATAVGAWPRSSTPSSRRWRAGRHRWPAQ